MWSCSPFTSFFSLLAFFPTLTFPPSTSHCLPYHVLLSPHLKDPLLCCYSLRPPVICPSFFHPPLPQSLFASPSLSPVTLLSFLPLFLSVCSHLTDTEYFPFLHGEKMTGKMRRDGQECVCWAPLACAVLMLCVQARQQQLEGMQGRLQHRHTHTHIQVYFHSISFSLLPNPSPIYTHTHTQLFLDRSR